MGNQGSTTSGDPNVSKSAKEDCNKNLITNSPEQDELENEASEEHVMNAFPALSEDQANLPSQTSDLKDFIDPIPDSQFSEHLVQHANLTESTVEKEEDDKLVSETFSEEASVSSQSNCSASVNSSLQESPKIELLESVISQDKLQLEIDDEDVGTDEVQAESNEVQIDEIQVGSDEAQAESNGIQVENGEAQAESNGVQVENGEKSIVTEKLSTPEQSNVDEEIKAVDRKSGQKSDVKKVTKERQPNKRKRFPLAADDQLKADFALEPYVKGTRVFANWDGTCYPAYVLSSDLPGRCEVLFVDGNTKRHAPFDGIVPLAILKAGDLITLTSDESDLVKQVQITSIPSKEDSEEWLEGGFEVDDDTQILKCNWTQLIVNKHQKKDFLDRLEKMKTAAIVDAPRPRRSTTNAQVQKKRKSDHSSSKSTSSKKRVRK